MLDQNTDRMWYVIGAVIVGAALIFLMNGAFPTLFANVGQTFEDKADDAMDIIDDTTLTDGVRPLQPNLIDLSEQEIYYDQRVDSDTGVVVANDYRRWLGKDITASTWYSMIGQIPVTSRTRYEFASEELLASPIVVYYAPDGTFLEMQYFGGEQESVVTKSPRGAGYALIGAGDSRIKPERGMVAIETWSFKRK